MHKFKNSLKVGKDGETLLHKLWPALERIDGRAGDFRLPNGEKLEVKSDTYNHDTTENFFMERWSDFDKKKPGGPWQALAHGCQNFFYWFPKNRIGYLFNTQELVDILELIEHTLKPVMIENVRWLTIGYKVPRATLSKLWLRKDF